jgi:uncharacterized protein YlxP (DUF503 family)
MRAAAVRLELQIPEARSLKEKRAKLRPVIEGLRRKLSVSVSEVDHHDAWQRSSIGVAVVAPDSGRLEELLTQLQRYVDSQLEVEVFQMAISYLEEPL